MTRVAAIDCGTNSIRLLIADVDHVAGVLTEVFRTMTVVRLGEGVDRTGTFSAEALERTFVAVDEYANACRDYQVEAIRFVATSATRDVANREVFIEGVRQRLGIDLEVISGVEEAQLSFRGATHSLATKHPGPYVVVDLGGGSTEIVVGDSDVVAAFSMDVGCVRMTERHCRSNPPTAAEMASLTSDVQAALDDALVHVPVRQARTLIGLAGSITTVTAHTLGLQEYDSVAIHQTETPIDATMQACAELASMTRAERAQLPYMHPGRVDVIGAGALVWAEVITRIRDEVATTGYELRSVVTSEHDILDGVAWSAANPGRIEGPP